MHGRLRHIFSIECNFKIRNLRRSGNLWLTFSVNLLSCLSRKVRQESKVRKSLGLSVAKQAIETPERLPIWCCRMAFNKMFQGLRSTLSSNEDAQLEKLRFIWADFYFCISSKRWTERVCDLSYRWCYWISKQIMLDDSSY